MNESLVQMNVNLIYWEFQAYGKFERFLIKKSSFEKKTVCMSEMTSVLSKFLWNLWTTQFVNVFYVERSYPT